MIRQSVFLESRLHLPVVETAQRIEVVKVEANAQTSVLLMSQTHETIQLDSQLNKPIKFEC